VDPVMGLSKLLKGLRAYLNLKFVI
jgi:hypothetical protein